MSAKLQIGNLPRTMDSVALGQLLEEYGAVRNAEIVIDDDTRHSTGSALVEMGSEEEALLAMLTLDGTECMGQSLRVQQVESVEPEQDELPKVRGPDPGGFGDRSGRRSTWGRLS